MPFATLDPTNVWHAQPHPFSLHVGSRDLIPVSGTAGLKIGVPIETISISEVGGNGASTMSFLYEDPLRSYLIPARGQVDFQDHTTAAPSVALFTGYVVGRETVPAFPGLNGQGVLVSCVDHNLLLDTHVVPALKYKAGYDDKALIQGVIGHTVRSSMVQTHNAFVTSTKSNMPAMDFSHITLRAAIEAIAQAAGSGRIYYVDFFGRFHYYAGPAELAMGYAPYVFSDVPTAGQLAATDLQFEYDDTQIANAVYVHGASPAGSGWVRDLQSIAVYGLIQATMEAPHCKTAAHLESVGRSFLTRHKDPIVRGSFSYQGTETGFRVGQLVTISNVSLGLTNAVYPIRQIDTTFAPGGRLRNYRFSIGELPANRSRKPGAVTGPVQGGTPPHGTAPAVGARTIGYFGLRSDTTRL